MKHLATALCGIIGSNVPFCGAIGALSRDVEHSQESRKGWTIGRAVVGGVTTTIFWPIGVAILAGSRLTGSG